MKNRSCYPFLGLDPHVHNIEIPTFLSERGYDVVDLPADWEIPRKELDDG